MKQRQRTLISGLMVVGLSLASSALVAKQDHQGHDQGQKRMMQRNGQSEEGPMTREGGGMMNREEGQEGGMGGEMTQRMEKMHTNWHRGDSNSGQSAFDLISEVVDQFEANPDTDWESVNIAALRQHLVDMNQITLYAQIEAADVDGGARYVVTGNGITRDAIKRMVPTHAAQLQSEIGWTTATETKRGGVTLTVTSADPAQAAKIRGLGFLGFMVQGEHHEGHHLMMAGGQSMDHSSMSQGSMDQGSMDQGSMGQGSEGHGSGGAMNHEDSQ